MDEYRLFGPTPGRCWDCGAPSLRVVSDGDDTDFVCDACGATWHVELGQVQRVRQPDDAPPADADLFS